MVNEYPDLKRKSKYTILAEILFILLPLIIYSIINSIKGVTINNILYLPEWSFASVLFYGQSLVKLGSGLAASTKTNKNWQLGVLIISAIIVLCLVPSITILSSLLLATKPVSVWLIRVQHLYFLFGIFTYYAIGTVGEMLLDR